MKWEFRGKVVYLSRFERQLLVYFKYFAVTREGGFFGNKKLYLGFEVEVVGC